MLKEFLAVPQSKIPIDLLQAFAVTKLLQKGGEGVKTLKTLK
jgi:hypothetical protein